MSAPAAATAAASAGSKRSYPDAATGLMRCVQPRHFHFGRNPAAASASGDAADAEADHPPPAARLYRHALESIFGWLNQCELAKALQVSTSWLAAVESMASLRLTVRKTSAPICVLANSAVGHHITQLGSEDARWPLTADALFILVRLMTQLRELRCEMQLTPSIGPLIFPPGLQTLDLRVTGGSTAADVNAAIRVISLLPLLESFTIRLNSFDDQLSFAPLASLPQVRDLSIFVPDFNAELSDAQVAELRAMPLLRRLDVQPMPTSLLRRLLVQPHNLQWQEIRLPRPLDDEAAELLPQLSSLTKIDALCAVSNFDWLQQLANLAHVGVQDEIDDESLLAGLRSCSKIEVLGLGSQILLTAHLADLLPQLPRLRTLELIGLNIDSLSFLARGPMTRQLTCLSLIWCTELPLTELRHVHSLRALTSLQLRQSCSERMDSHCQSLYTPPSLLMPQLQKFEYTAP